MDGPCAKQPRETIAFIVDIINAPKFSFSSFLVVSLCYTNTTQEAPPTCLKKPLKARAVVEETETISPIDVEVPAEGGTADASTSKTEDTAEVAGGEGGRHHG